MAESPEDLVRKTDIYCPHCEDFVPKTTYYRHRQQFCKADGEWIDANLLTKKSSITKPKTTAYQAEYPAQLGDDFSNAFMDTSEISMGPNESADEQEFRAEGRFVKADA